MIYGPDMRGGYWVDLLGNAQKQNAGALDFLTGSGRTGTADPAQRRNATEGVMK